MPELTEDDIDQEVEEARSGFDLRARLEGRQLRTSTIELFTDEVTGAKHLENEQKLEAYKLILEAANVKGLVIDDATKAGIAVAKKDQARILREQPKLLEELHKTSLSLELRATPRIVKEAATRHAHKAAGSKPGGWEPEQIGPFSDAFSAYIIAHMVMGYTDNQTGTRVSHLTIANAQALREFLPDHQYKRLEEAVTDLQDRNVISEAVTASADFSQAG